MRELTDNQMWDAFFNFDGGGSAIECFRSIIAADRALNAECHDPLAPKQLEVIADPTLRAVCEAYTNTPGGHFVRLQAVAKLMSEPADRDVMRQAPEGWRLVPNEPTHEMIYMMTRATNNLAERIDSYHKMLAAAPTPPAEQQGEQSIGLHAERTMEAYSEGCRYTRVKILTELRAKVEALPNHSIGVMCKLSLVNKADVLAEIDKLGGRA